MIVKVTSYFSIERQEDAEKIESELLISKLQDLIEEYLSDSSFKLAGSSWTDTRIKAFHRSREQALDELRTRK